MTASTPATPASGERGSSPASPARSRSRATRSAPLRELLALPDERLIEALGARAGGDVAARARATPTRAPCAPRPTAAALAAVCRHDAALPGRLRDLRDAPAVLFVAAASDPLGGSSASRAARTATIRRGVDRRRAPRVGRGQRGRAGARARHRAPPASRSSAGWRSGSTAPRTPARSTAAAATIAVLAGGADVPYPSSKRAAVPADRRRGLRRVRDAARVRAVPVVLPGAQPHDRRARAHDRRGRGRRALGLADHRRGRRRPRARRRRPAGAGDVVAGARHERAAARRRGRSCATPRTCSTSWSALDRVARADPAAGLEPRLASLLRAVGGGRDTLAALAGAPDQAQRTLAALDRARAPRPPAPRARRPLRRGATMVTARPSYPLPPCPAQRAASPSASRSPARTPAAAPASRPT